MPRYQQFGPIIFAQLTTAERDAGWPTPPDNLVILNVTEGVVQVYIGGEWVNVAFGGGVTIVASLPGSGDDGDVVYLTTDQHLYVYQV